MRKEEITRQIAALREKVRLNEEDLWIGLPFPEIVTSHTQACLEQIELLERELAAVKADPA